MPGTYSIDAGRRLVISRAWGVVASGELLCHVRAVATDPAFEPSFCQIADLRSVTGMDFNLATVREVARMNPFGPDARRAIVLDSDVGYAVIRMYLMMRGTHAPQIRVFKEMDAAMAWLGLADEDATAIAALIATSPPLVTS